MINVKEENKIQSNNIKEGTNEFLDNQRQQIENTTSNYFRYKLLSIGKTTHITILNFLSPHFLSNVHQSIISIIF